MGVQEQLALIRVEEYRAEGAAERQVHLARVLARRARRPGPLRAAVGRELVRAGLRLANETPVPQLIGTMSGEGR